jgi:Ca2+-transporting ATPase
VFAQISNSINSRRLDRKLNIFEGLLKNYYFMGITILEIAVQVLIVFVGGDAFQVTSIGGREWGISLALGVVAIPIGAAVRLLPNEPFEKLFTATRLLPKGDVLPTTQQQMEWSPAVDQVRDGLRTFGGLRGGRLRASSYVAKTRVANVQTDAAHQVPALLTMIPSMVVSGVTTNWKLQPGSLSDPASADPSKSSAALWEGKMEVHPDTNADDDAFKLLARHVPAKAGAGAAGSASNV